jgi:hypothetical protein
MRWFRAFPVVAIVPLLILRTAVAAYAHTTTYATKVGIHASDTRVSPGEQVRFSGHLRSPRAGCEAHSMVKLVKVGVGVRDRAKTNAEGRYVFEIGAPRGDWRVRFPGKVLVARDPHDHTCVESRSQTLTVREFG